MNSCYLVVAASPPPTLFHFQTCNSVVRRGPRLKFQQGRDLKSIYCCYGSKKSTGPSDYESSDESDGLETEKKVQGKSPRRGRRKAVASTNPGNEDATEEDTPREQLQQVPSQRSTAVYDVLEHEGESGPVGSVEEKKRSRRGRKKSSEEVGSDSSNDDQEVGGVKETGTGRRTRRGRPKALPPKNFENEEEVQVPGKEEIMRRRVNGTTLTKEAPAVERRGRRKDASIADEQVTQTESSRGTSRMNGGVSQLEDFTEANDVEELESGDVVPSEESELHVVEDDTEDISYTYDMLPLVCCFGAARHGFLPSGRPSNRLINHDIHESMEDALWSPKKFVRAPAGSSSSIAIALSSLGGRVAFMGKLGNDEYGQRMLYHLNVNNVQTRAIKMDGIKSTAVSHMKILRRGSLRVSLSRPCAEDSLLRSEICNDVLREAKMFHFTSSSLLDPNMRKTTLHAIKTSKKYGGVIFFDLNLPLLLWHSRDDTIKFIQEAWNLANVIEVTKQEFEFICGIEPTEKFDTKDNDRSKFTHYNPEVLMPLWHENLMILFVTNGTSRIHYYTQNDNGWVHGMEDAPITPFTADMSASGDAIVAALLKMLSVQSDFLTDRGHIRRTIKYAIDSGILDQWLVARTLGFPPRVLTEGVSSISEQEYRTVSPCDYYE